MPDCPVESSNFLVVRLSSFGDIVLAEPVTRRLKEAFPQSTIWFATYAQYAGIPALFASVDTTVSYSRAGKRAQPDRDIETLTFDAVIDLQRNLRSASIVRRARARRVLRYRRQYFRRLLCVYWPRIWRGNLKHTVELYLDAIGPLGADTAPSPPRLAVPPDAVAALTRELGQGPFVGICPGGSSPHKMWGERRFIDLVGRLRSGGHRVLAIGSQSDADQVSAVVSGLGDAAVRVVVGNDVAKIAGALSLCKVTVSNDSGLMHLAAGVGSKVVAIFGPTSPILGFAPLAPGSVVVTRGLACSPCSYHGNRACRYERRHCMEDIEPSEVATIVDEITGADA
jgi:heptosyltransferase-2